MHEELSSVTSGKTDFWENYVTRLENEPPGTRPSTGAVTILLTVTYTRHRPPPELRLRLRGSHTRSADVPSK